jgi:hypothetical protein
VRRIAAAVETGNDRECLVGLDDEHERVGKAVEQGAADAFINDRKLPGIGAHALNHGINRCAETTRPKPGTSFSYQSCASINSARAAGVKITGMLRAALLKLGLQSRPCDASAPVLVKSLKAVIKLRLLRGCKGELAVFQTVPKLRD